MTITLTRLRLGGGIVPQLNMKLVSEAVDFLVVLEYDAATDIHRPPYSPAPISLELLKRSVAEYARRGVSMDRLVLSMP